MFVTNHVLAGTLLGTRLRARPAAALAAGIASHLAMDALPHWSSDGDQERWLRAARRDGLLGLGALGAVAVATPPGSRVGVLAGALGAVLPDLRAPFQVAFDVQPLPEALDRVHDAVQEGKEASRWLPVEVVAGAALGLAASAALGRARRDPSGALGRRRPDAGA